MKTKIKCALALGIFVLAVAVFQRYDAHYFIIPPKPSEASRKVFDRERAEWPPVSTYERLMAKGDILAAQKEAKRLANWKKNFPWKPATDPNVIFDPMKHVLYNAPPGSYLHRSSLDSAIVENHPRLKRFFQNEARFSAPFEQMYRILAEHDRGHNPVIAGWLFGYLWGYQRAARHDPGDPMIVPVTSVSIDPVTGEQVETTFQRRWKAVRNRDGTVSTWGEEADRYKRYIMWNLTSSDWLNRRFSTEAGYAEAEGLRDRLIEQVQGMDAIPYPSIYGLSPEEKALGKTYDELMSEGHPATTEELLVPYEGWAEDFVAYEAELIHIEKSISHLIPSSMRRTSSPAKRNSSGN
ncbi:MAG: hypothetical protein M2R45_04711 [Verrucomicrobia subdivision 3 bacterium]|nr:hypothetical protein [Limisphaerales bacterium]MCS1416266.1 hypothetical protein [Limisphaerales bacterium]